MYFARNAFPRQFHPHLRRRRRTLPDSCGLISMRRTRRCTDLYYLVPFCEGFAVDRTSQLLQATFLQALCDEKTPVFIFLVNGIKLHGTIQSFDNYVLAVQGDVTQIVFKHAISTVMPASGGIPPGSSSGPSGARSRPPRGGPSGPRQG